MTLWNHVLRSSGKAATKRAITTIRPSTTTSCRRRQLSAVPSPSHRNFSSAAGSVANSDDHRTHRTVVAVGLLLTGLYGSTVAGCEERAPDTSNEPQTAATAITEDPTAADDSVTPGTEHCAGTDTLVDHNPAAPDNNMFEQDPPDYSLLPEHDEDTHCSICTINRQGPCRNPWRWFEKCMKEHPTTDDSNPCAKATMAWFMCVEQHRELYSYYTNRHFEPELNRMEHDMTDRQRRPFPVGAEPDVDASRWAGFREALEDDVVEDEEAATTDPTAPPRHFIAASARFRLVDDATGYPLELAYVRDQQGKLLGFDYFSREKQDGDETGDMTFLLTPDTTQVTAHGLYRAKVLEVTTGEQQQEEGDKTGEHDQGAVPENLGVADTNKEQQQEGDKTGEHDQGAASENLGVADTNKNTDNEKPPTRPNEGVTPRPEILYTASMILEETTDDDSPSPLQ